MDNLALARLLCDTEADWIERKESAADTGKICEAICAFANDMPNHQQPGILFIGAKNDGSCANLSISDELLRNLASLRSDGNILPPPTMKVQKITINNCELATIIVEPSLFPPVRYKGRTWIRVGPRRATATEEEEIRLSEKRRSKNLPFDLCPISTATIADLDELLFQREYLPQAVAPEVIDQNKRSLEQQLKSLRFLSVESFAIPTVLGLLTLGKTPRDFLPGAYVQFLRLDGEELTDAIIDQKEISGPFSDLLRQLDDLLKLNIQIRTNIQKSTKEERFPDYPIEALRQLVRNAIMHRDYQSSNAPVRLTWFTDRIEIQNPGGPFGIVTRSNFGQPGMADYRNPHIAEAMKILGYVQKFGVGIQLARRSLLENENPPPQFMIEDHFIQVTIRRRT